MGFVWLFGCLCVYYCFYVVSVLSCVLVRRLLVCVFGWLVGWLFALLFMRVLCCACVFACVFAILFVGLLVRVFGLRGFVVVCVVRAIFVFLCEFVRVFVGLFALSCVLLDCLIARLRACFFWVCVFLCVMV